MTNNQYALHTPPGCSQADIVTQSGTTDETDCATDQGCLVAENKPDSYGPGFAAAGGGVFALQLDATGINIWFFSVCPTSFCFFFDKHSHYISGPKSPPSSSKQPPPLKWTRAPGVSQQPRIPTLRVPCKNSSPLSN